MKITYAVTVCDEFIEIQRLLGFLLQHKRPQDEIVVQMDLNVAEINQQPEAKQQVFGYIMKMQEQGHIRVILHPLDGDFAAFKNHLTAQCTGDYIFQIDADEIPHVMLITLLPDLLKENFMCEAILVPRINTVEGLTQKHIDKWQWRVNDSGWINWPDEQWRIYRNDPKIKWINRVHERLDGFGNWTILPIAEEFALYHPKTIDRQERQNNFYDTL